MVKVHVVKEMLSDESEVFNVWVAGVLKLPAVTERDAICLADCITAAINDHTTETAELVCW